MNCLSLFANIGVGNAYINNVKIANELDVNRCKVYKHLYPNTNVIQGDIKLKEKEIIETSLNNNIKLIIATPPCQGFSTLNNKNKGSKNNLILDTINIIKNINPDYVLIENVPTILTTKIDDKNILDIFKENLKYHIEHKILNANEFNTPQNRKRAIFLLSKNNKIWKFPNKTNNKILTLNDTIRDLPTLESNQTSNIKWHFANKINENHIIWMKHTPTGKSAFQNEIHFPKTIDKLTNQIRKIKAFQNTYKRMEWDQPAPTLIRSASMISSSNTVHPGRLLKDNTYSDARTLTILEAMIIMGLPTNFNLPDNLKYKDGITYLGEGICPKMVKALYENLPL